MNINFPNIDEMTTVEAISWYTKTVVEVTCAKNRVAGIFTDEYKQALLRWKEDLNRKALVERNNF